MPEVPLIATGPFTYRTRRLVAEEPFQARNPLEARILTRVRKVAKEPEAKAERVAPKVEEVLAAEVVEEPKPAEPVKAAATRKAPAKAGAKARAKKAKAKK